MPLIKSKSPAAFSKNIARERAAGKPEDQAVAIAYSEKRAAGGRDKMPASKMDKMRAEKMDKMKSMKMDGGGSMKMAGMDSMHGGSPHMMAHEMRRMKESKGY